MIRQILEHARNCRTVRQLLRAHPTENLRNLYWYDQRLEDAVRWRGILMLLAWNLTRREDDEIAGNYDLVNLYFAPARGDGLDRPAAAVWHCETLDSRPWWDEPSPVRAALEENAEAAAPPAGS